MVDAARILVLSVLVMATSPSQAGVAGRSTPLIACPSLSNLRILVKRARDDLGVAAAGLADAKADHLGCILLDRDRVASIVERAAFGGHDYACLAIRGTSVCHWTLAGSLPVLPANGAKP